jgi:PAS domain S-box-containing protein
VVDASGRLVARNQASIDHTPTATEVADLFPPESRADLAAAMQHATTEAASFEWIDGARRWFSASVVPLEHGLVISSRDVSAMKRSEQLMVDTQGVAHLGTWEWDVTQPTAKWSAELYRIYGLTPESYTPSYEAYLTMVHPDDRQRVIDATNRVFHEHVPYSHDERIFRPDGSIRHLHTWAHPVLDAAGKLQSLLGVCQDITDRVAAEEAVRRANAELEQRVSERTAQLQIALRELDAFNSMVSHDLRSPLAVIQMAVDIIGQQPDVPPKVAANVDRVRRAVKNMSQLVSDLLSFAKLGHEAIQPADVDVSALCHELIAEHPSDRNVEVTIEPALKLRVDPTLFRSALANLIGNAWKYSGRASSPRIEVGTAHRADGRALYVRDNGIGFDMAEHDRLFEPFTRLANATEFKGTGLGLATVARIVERHGGTISAEGSRGNGATFFLALPAAAWL